MTQKELTDYNIGQNLDWIANLDPRGYGVCRILYDAARRYTGEPLSLHAAKVLCEHVGTGDLVYILTGFVLLDNQAAETDGIVGSMLLCRALARAFGAKPVIVCPEENLPAVQALSRVVGLHLYESIAEARENPVSMAVIPFTKDKAQAARETEALLQTGLPAAVVAIECPGENAVGEYHNSKGRRTTPLEAKTDVLFERLKQAGVPDIAIGDLGNELGMGTLSEQLARYIPRAAEGTCVCGCGGGLAARVGATHLITATVSDWGCYALMAALAYLQEDMEIFHDADLEAEALTAAARSGMVDMYGWTIPAIDGFDLQTNRSVVTMMRECIRYAPKLRETCREWFDETLALGYFETV